MEHSYAAGLFDGEGYVRVAIWHKPNSPHIRYQVIVGIGVTHRPVIEMLKAQYGGSINENRHDLRNPRNRIQFTWHVASQTAAKFLRLILPYLVIKRDQVELALQLQDNIDQYKLRGGNWNNPTPERIRIREERAALAAQIKSLKKVSFPSSSIVGPVSSVNGH